MALFYQLERAKESWNGKSYDVEVPLKAEAHEYSFQELLLPPSYDIALVLSLDFFFTLLFLFASL